MTKGITKYIAEVRELSVEHGWGDSPTVSRFFGAALYNEDMGNEEAAERFLNKALAAEEAGE